ncbi:MAG TPA: hypothetical protein VHR85_10350 [Nocardioides sp.]|nr:hypothetical protein [Nocardioides sp.]
MSVSQDPTVELWRHAAIELLAASHALSAASNQPWRADPGAGWWVLGDVAVALEAVLVLDTRLEEVGVLSGHDRSVSAMGLAEQRMVLSQTARVAGWEARTAAADEAIARVPRQARSSVLQPVSLVAAPEDLAGAQEMLGRFLSPMVARDSFYCEEPEISAECARQVAASQLFLCRTFAHAAAYSATTSVFVRFFEQRAEVLAAWQPQLSYLIDVSAHEPNMRRFWQQSELTTAVARMVDHGVRIKLQPGQMVELARATHTVTHNLGKSLRRELLRANSNLRDGHPRHEYGPVRVGKSSKLETTLTDLVKMPNPTNRSPGSATHSSEQRSSTSWTRPPHPLGQRHRSQPLAERPTTPPRSRPTPAAPPATRSARCTTGVIGMRTGGTRALEHC